MLGWSSVAALTPEPTVPTTRATQPLRIDLQSNNDLHRLAAFCLDFEMPIMFLGYSYIHRGMVLIFLTMSLFFEEEPHTTDLRTKDVSCQSLRKTPTSEEAKGTGAKTF